MIPASRRARAVGLLLAIALVSRCTHGTDAPDEKPEEAASPDPAALRERNDLLARARVWEAPAVPVGQADLFANPPGPDALAREGEVRCRFRARHSKGQTPKVECVLASGESIKVKVGEYNEEVRTEVAATRLLTALGFGADRMYVVGRVVCEGCPQYPYPQIWWLHRWMQRLRGIAVYDWAVVERRRPGRRIPGEFDEGWGFWELGRIDPKKGGSPRAHVDALRLMAVFLANWDNKTGNQKLICPDGEGADGGCPHPFAFMHDLGGTFGPDKRDLVAWRGQPVWTDPATCLVSMKRLPFGGGTFSDAHISEEGRAFLAGLLGQLHEKQIRDLFEGARFATASEPDAARREIDGWVQAFRAKVSEITDGRCPAVPAK